MTHQEIVKSIEELKSDFDSLEAIFNLFKESIEKQIDWFYAVLSIIIGVLLAALFFLVKSQVENGIKKGIDKSKTKYDELIKQQFEKISNLENALDELLTKVLDKENEIGSFSAILIQGEEEKVLSEHLNFYYKFGRIVILDLNILINDFEDSQAPIILKGLPFTVKSAGANLLSMSNHRYTNNINPVLLAKVSKDNPFISLSISNDNERTRFLTGMDIKDGTIIQGKIIYQISE